MRRTLPHSVPLLAALLLCCYCASADGLSDAVSALQRGDFTAAETLLRTELKSHPNDESVLTLLAVALDNEKNYSEADAIYRRATALAPHSASLLNNYGNHLLARGDSAGARAAFLKVVGIDPTHVNANIQLARIALGGSATADALHYLQRIPAPEQAAPEVALLRMRALYLSDRMAEADGIAAELARASESDVRLGFSTGLELAAAKQYDKAEMFFSRVLESAPANFDVLYNLGLAASRAGHKERAHDVLQAALEQRPGDVDTLYNLAAVDAALNQKEGAVELLAAAAPLAPQRSDIQLLLAHLTSDLGYYADSRQAWNRYAQLMPHDDLARRERGYAAAILGDHGQSTADLQWYAGKHPEDAIGHYELGIAETVSDVDRAFAELDRALALKPDLTAAIFSRGLLNYQQNKLAAALTDLEAANKALPDNAIILDRLGQTYLALDRTVDAVSVLSQAAKLAPQDPRTLLHFGRALAKAGRREEAQTVMARVRQLGPEPSRRRGGLIDFFSLSPEEQYSHFRARLEKTVEENPQDGLAQLQYLKLLLDDGNMKQAALVAHKIAELAPNETLLADAGEAVLEAGQYAMAKEFLEQAVATQTSTRLQLQLAIATSHLVSPQAGLRELDKITPTPKGSGYYLARAEMLDASGQFEDAVATMNRALRETPKQPELYRQAAFLLIKNNRISEAIDLLEQGSRILNNSPEILLTKATTLELGRKTAEAERLLNEIQNRWPEWPSAWLAHGIILETYKRYDEARQMIETAVMLGARGGEAYFYLAESTLYTSPDRIEDAEKAIQQALPLAPDDPWVHALAGRIAFEKKQYTEAVAQLQEAIRLRPHLVQAHYNLAQAYKAMGERRESELELEQVTMIHLKFPDSEEDSNDLSTTLFQVGPLREH
jgi:tetratricopeptide (TPR) repeat protein